MLPGPDAVTPWHRHKSSGWHRNKSNSSLHGCLGCSAPRAAPPAVPSLGQPLVPVSRRQTGDRVIPTTTHFGLRSLKRPQEQRRCLGGTTAARAAAGTLCLTGGGKPCPDTGSPVSSGCSQATNSACDLLCCGKPAFLPDETRVTPLSYTPVSHIPTPTGTARPGKNVGTRGHGSVLALEVKV